MQDTLPIHFAPLQGYTEAIYRNAHDAFFGGVDTYYTPFVRLEKGNFRRRDVRGIEPENNGVPHLIPQLIASSAEKAEVILSLFIEKGYQEVVKALLSIVTRYPQISFSVKMRLGWEQPDECLALAPILNDLPLRQITMHPRLGKQGYKGEVDLQGFSAFREVCQLPLVYNGDIHNLEDIQRISTQFPSLAGIMIGRGLLANPALALEYKENRTLAPDEMRDRLKSMHKSVYNNYDVLLEGGEGQLLTKMKTFWEYLAPQTDRKVLKAIHKSTNISKYYQAVSAFFNQR